MLAHQASHCMSKEFPFQGYFACGHSFDSEAGIASPTRPELELPHLCSGKVNSYNEFGFTMHTCQQYSPITFEYTDE